MNTGTVQIMWKEIIVGFIILYLLRGVLDAVSYTHLYLHCLEDAINISMRQNHGNWQRMRQSRTDWQPFSTI